MPKDNRILASVALFSELYDRNQDVFDLVSNFIKSAILLEGKNQFTVDEIGVLLQKHFEIRLPGSVVRTVLKRRLKPDGFCRSVGHDEYSCMLRDDEATTRLTNEFQQLQTSYESLVEKLLEHTKNHVTGGESADEGELKTSFHKFLLAEPVPEFYMRLCSAFVVDHSSDATVTEATNQVREGLVVYSGISSARELSELGTWRHNLNIVLDTELLVDMGGFNGDVYKAIFDDFHGLVRELNGVNQSKSVNARISLSYFEESKYEVERIFGKAEEILSGISSAPITTTALRTVLEGCTSASDVLAKKVMFFNRLGREGIRQIDQRAWHEKISFNVESQELLTQLPSELNVGRSRRFDEEALLHVLRQFTAINELRSGVSGTTLETSRAVLLTRDRITRLLGSNSKVKFHARDFEFAVDLDHVINRLWFNLNKGFTDKTTLPKAFDVVTRAQIALAAQMRSAVTRRYQDVLESRAKGEITDDGAQELFAELRSKEVQAAQVDEGTVDEILTFLSDTDISARIKELHTIKQTAAEVPTLRSTLEDTAKALEVSRSEARRLAAEKFGRLRERNTRIRLYVRSVAGLITVLLPLLIGIGLFLVIRALKSEADTWLAIFFGVGAFLLALVPFIAFWKAFHRWIRRLVDGIPRQRRKKKRLRGELRFK